MSSGHTRFLGGLQKQGVEAAQFLFEQPGGGGFGLALEGVAADEFGEAAGLVDVEATACGERVIAPALRLTAARLSSTPTAPTGHRIAARLLLWQVELLWRGGIIDYLLLRAVRP